MRKIKLVAIALITVASYSCKEVKKEKKETQVTIEDTFTVSQDSTKVSFTAYKTTAKKGVGGKFTKIDVKNARQASSAIEAIEGLEFSIPVSSLFTNDATGTRDPKIKEFFFGVMDNTEFISGTFKFDSEHKCYVDLKLNGVSAKLPIDCVVTENRYVTFKGVLNLEKWNALDALASLNKVCEVLHTGEDGVSKTWSDVTIEASTYLR